jgi:uncharacterized 2Fe-2S/4Fe-4S cluster protein (DUF4445 family)
VPTSCRRQGRCRECIVEIRSGDEHLSPRTDAESFLRAPFRLACQAAVIDQDAEVEFEVVRRRLQIVGSDADDDPIATLDPKVAVESGVVCWGEQQIEPQRGRVCGVAVDLGTTTIALELVDLLTGRLLAASAVENPQRFGGSDVMNRISYDSVQPGELRQAARRALNGELRDLYARAGIERREVYEIVVVGNSTMRDILFGLDVSSIGQRPYKSITELELLDGRRASTELVRFAWELGLKAHPKARVWGAPLIASHVGADVAADLIATSLGERGECAMLIDVGTNTEVVVSDGSRTLAASCPAGPAFEGGEVSYGMQAARGAIESVALAADGSFATRTIGGDPPLGLCGSGLIDLIALLRRAERMSAKGVFSPRAHAIEVVPARGITFSRADASALAQAKAANSVGQWILLRTLGIDPAQLRRVYLAGGFAKYVDVRNAIEIGFLAPVDPACVVKVGNAALRGARRLLLSVSARETARRLAASIEHVELETTPDFFELFVDGCQFKPLPEQMRTRGDRVAI